MWKKFLTILLAYIPAGFVLSSILLVLILKWAPVTSTPLMLKRSLNYIGNKELQFRHQWVSLDDVSPEMVKAVIASEDSKFLWHNGFDAQEMSRMWRRHRERGSEIRGCSTISQQTAKNCFTLCGRTWFRKGLETYYTVLIEKIWGKRRIMEVYLNVAEMGPGIFGIEAASQYYYHISPSELTRADATALACCLPNPLYRNPEWVNRYLAGKRVSLARKCESMKIITKFMAPNTDN